MGDTFPYIRGLQDALNRDRSEVYMVTPFPIWTHSKSINLIPSAGDDAMALNHILQQQADYLAALEAVATPLRH